MKKFTILIIFAIIVIIHYCTTNTTSFEHFYQIPKRNLLGPSINGHLKTDKINKFNSDPNQYFVNNGFLIDVPYNEFVKNSFTNNIKKSIAFACVKEILNDTKQILNDNKKASLFDHFNVIELKPKQNDYKPLLNLIFNTINTVAKKYFLIKPQKLNEFKLFKSRDKFLFNIEILSNVTNYDDDIIKQKPIFNSDLNYEKIHNFDTLTQTNPLQIKIIIQIVMTPTNDDISIYINNLSAILNNDNFTI